MNALHMQRSVGGHSIGRKKSRQPTGNFVSWFWATSFHSSLNVGLILLNITLALTASIYARSSLNSACEVANLTLSQLGLSRQYCDNEPIDLTQLTALLHFYPYPQRPAPIDQEARADWWVPWPNNFVGRLGWYRQGLREVEDQRRYIRSLATEEVPAILIAAAIANQGNSPQRPFGWSGLERTQHWLGNRFEWQFTIWQGAMARWNNYFEKPSVGIGQIQPDEAIRLAYAGDRLNLFDDRVSIALMQAKLLRAAGLLAAIELNATDRFALIAISNNDNSDGARIYAQFEAVDRDLFKLLAQEEALRRQLARMLTYIDYLHAYDNWMLPDAINVERLWWYIESADPAS